MFGIEPAAPPARDWISLRCEFVVRSFHIYIGCAATSSRNTRRKIRSGIKSLGLVSNTYAQAATSSYVFFLLNNKSPTFTSSRIDGGSFAGKALFSPSLYVQLVTAASFKTPHSPMTAGLASHFGLFPLSILLNKLEKSCFSQPLSFRTGSPNISRNTLLSRSSSCCRCCLRWAISPSTLPSRWAMRIWSSKGGRGISESR